MSIQPTNSLAKLGIAAAHAMRLELADQLFSPIAVNINNPSQPMVGGTVGNRSGQPRRLSGNGVVNATPDGDGAAGNTGGYGADFNALEGDPISVVKTMTSDGPIFTIQKYDGSGVITVEDPSLNSIAPVPVNRNFSTVARYSVKSDGVVYDLLELRDVDTNNPNPNTTGPFRHWELANYAGGYVGGTNTYTPPQTPAGITLNDYTRPVGRISFRPKDGASAAVIQENLSRAQSTLDLMSRMLRSLHDESKGPFANIVVR